MEFLQQVCAFFSYIREKLFRCGTHYVPVSGNESDVENQYTIMFDAENGMMYNKL
jgi:hypothetical protein